MSEERVWTAALLIIGDEILSGRIQDRNVAPIATWLNIQGIRLSEVRVVPDVMERIVPVAEEHGVKLALHPDDPPISPIRGVGRILTSPEAMLRAIDLVPSPANGITMCQGTFATMGAVVPAEIRRFAARGVLHFVHFRDVRGTPDKFVETFHDDGKTDMYEAMRTYAEVGFDGPVRPDHVPTMAGEDNALPGYQTLGRLFALGYIKGLAEAAAKERGAALPVGQVR